MKGFIIASAVLFCAGVVYADANDIEEAKRNGTKALFSCGQKMEKAKKYEEAVDAYREIAATEKDVLRVQEALIKSAQAKLKLKDFGGAANDLDKILKLRKTDPKTGASNYQTAITRMAGIYTTRFNDHSGAIRLVDEALADENLAPGAKKRLKLLRDSLQRGQVNSLVAAKKYEEARKLAAENLKKMPGAASVASCINVEIACGKALTSKKQFDEADRIFRSASQIKGANARQYWLLQECILQNQMSKKDFAAAAKELEQLKKMPGGSKTGIVYAEVRFLLASGKNGAAIDLLVKSAQDTSFNQKERGNFYSSAALNTIMKLKDIKRTEEYYAQAKSLLGGKYKNAQVEKQLEFWKKKL
jgi:tetratricopeptide (TPR) repeat protein